MTSIVERKQCHIEDVNSNGCEHQVQKKRNISKVTPSRDGLIGKKCIVEIRPKREISIIHLNYQVNVHNVVENEDGDESKHQSVQKRSQKCKDHRNGITFLTNAQINHCSQNTKYVLNNSDPSDQNTLNDEETETQTSGNVSNDTQGTDNEGFHASLENIVNETSYSQTNIKAKQIDSSKDVISSPISSKKNESKQENKEESIAERSAAEGSVDLDFQEENNRNCTLTEVKYPENEDVIDHLDEAKDSIGTHIIDACTANTPKEAVIFFIHGVGGSSDVWKWQLDYFSTEGYEIVCPDLVGHGFSAAPKSRTPYTFEEISLDLLATFDRFCKKRNAVIGHSYGCCFAAVLARQRHRQVSKMILISGGGPIPLAPQPGIFSLPTCILACFKPIISRGFKKSAFHNKQDVSLSKIFDVPSYVLKYTMNGQWWPDGGVEYHQWINAPTLLIHGAQDKLVLVEEEEDMLETIFGSRMEVIDDTSHMVMMEKPDEVNKIIHDFLLQDVSVNNTSINKSSTRTREALKKKPWLRRALSKSKVASIEPKQKHTDDFSSGLPNGRSRSGKKTKLDRKGSTLSLKSVKSLPHDLVAGNLIR